MSEEISEKVTLRIKPNGAIRVNGTIDFVDESGAVVDTKSDFSICTCGKSQTAPVCDGSHKVKIEANNFAI